MYKEYWKLAEKPFENTPDPHFLFWSKQHEEALSRMLYVIKEKKGAAMITGEYGSGKTLLTRVLLKELSDNQYQTALILNPMLSPAQMIKEIITQLGGSVAHSASKAMVYNRLNELLVETNKNNKMAVIVVDEAQAIQKVDSFEEFRLLLNFQLNQSFLLTLILVGQPELREKIDELPQLKQRLAMGFHLKSLKPEETKEYIVHRLKVAGGNPEIFCDDAFGEIYNFTQGIPRKINNVCDMALLVGSGEGAQCVNQTLIRKVVADIEGKEFEELELTQAKT